MKKFILSNRFHSTFSFAILLSILFTFSACKKQDTDTPTISMLRVINASPALATYFPFVNGNIISSAALPYAGTTAYSSYASGSTSLKFTSENTNVSLLTKSIDLNTNAYHSFYLIDKPGSLDGLTITDDLSLPATDKAYIRYINLSPDAPALDLAKTGETTALVTNKAYKTASAFVAVAAGAYTFDAKETSTGSIKAVSASATLVAGIHYDVICGGLLNPANDTERTLNVQVLTIK